MQYLWLLVIPAAVLFLLYLRFFLRRLKLLLRLRKGKGEAKVKVAFGFFLPAARRRAYDLVILGGDRALCVKCVGLFLSTCEVHFESETVWYARKQWLRGAYVSSLPLFRAKGKARRIGLPQSPDTGDRRIVPVLLLSPAKKLLRVTGPSGYLRPGDRLGRYVFADGAILRKIAEEL
ncbi:MAG: hypothetical protein IJC53_03550 [Clostridia bacterium]|nr:hypothetical protein [Clostridia bacterium]